jgi:hypothetical protein
MISKPGAGANGETGAQVSPHDDDIRQPMVDARK